ncbi:MAG: hypothetical protein HC941_17080 [Microcoleus sp. SU_5_3]|nr:hypothetical protein [Microcoleus sp. SU_5_3]
MSPNIVADRASYRKFLVITIDKNTFRNFNQPTFFEFFVNFSAKTRIEKRIKGIRAFKQLSQPG